MFHIAIDLRIKINMIENDHRVMLPGAGKFDGRRSRQVVKEVRPSLF